MAVVSNNGHIEVTNHSPQFDGIVSVKGPIKRKRSRLGCFNCKKLKIKCSEGKPSCEYCEHRGNHCVYPIPETNDSEPDSTRSRKRQKLKKEKGDFEKFGSLKGKKTYSDFCNRSMVKLNSMSSQMQVTNFESKLLKIFLDFGPSFFTFDIDRAAQYFWINEAPQLCVSSNLVKQAVYAVSSTRLLYFYETTFLEGSRPENLDIFRRSVIYQEKTNLELLDLLKRFDYSTLSPDVMGQITVAKMIMIGCKGIFPKTFKEGVSITKDCGIAELLNFIQRSSPAWSITIPNLKNTKYITLFALDESYFHESANEGFPFVQFLRCYVNDRLSEALDVSQLTHHHAISMLELGAERAEGLDFPLPLFKSSVKISRDEDFTILFKNNDHTAMKIMFYHSALCSALDFRLFPGFGIWDEFVDIYKNHSYALFDGKFEDDFDRNTYDIVITGRSSAFAYDLRLLRDIGKPLEFIIGKYSQLSSGRRASAPLHRQQFAEQKQMWSDLTSRF